MVYALPGPDMALVLQTSTLRGVRAGLATALGLALARALHVVLSACGLAALLTSAPGIYHGIRLVGALYLMWIAVQVFRAQPLRVQEAGMRVAVQALRSSVLRGFWGNLLNPKALLFCSVFLPQFVRPEAAAVWAQMVWLGALLVGVGVAFDILLVFGAARLGRWLSAHPRAQTVQRWAFSSVLFGFAWRLSIE